MRDVTGRQKNFFLASRGESILDDFDGGGIRSCEVIRRLDGWQDDGFWVVRVDPPIREPEFGEMAEVVLARRHSGESLARLPRRSEIHVHVCIPLEPIPPTLGPIDHEDLKWQWWGTVARNPKIFGPTQKERWAGQLGRISDFIRQHGHSRIPESFEEGGNLGVLVKNLRRDKKEGQLEPGIERDLNELDGWEW